MMGGALACLGLNCMTLSALSQLIAESEPLTEPLLSEYNGQALEMPRSGNLYPSKGWTIWTFTDLDWLIMQGLPVNAYLRRYHCEDLEESQLLLAECGGRGI